MNKAVTLIIDSEATDSEFADLIGTSPCSGMVRLGQWTNSPLELVSVIGANLKRGTKLRFNTKDLNELNQISIDKATILN